MSTYRLVVYLVLDEIKSLGGDSTITEDHVLFLLNEYRLFLLELKLKQEGDDATSTDNYLTLCLNLELTNEVPGLDYCNETLLRSKEEIPDTVTGTTANVYPVDYFSVNFAYIPRNRFKFVGHNKYMRNIIYCTMGIDKHLYFKGNNPQFLYMKEAKFSGIFEDADAAAALSCDGDTEDTKCDIMDKDFPLDADLVPQLILMVVKELYSMEWRQSDDVNNSKDDIADLLTYISKNAKTDLQKKLMGE